MKLLKNLLLIVLIIGVAGYEILHFETNIAFDKIMNVVTAELENSEQIEDDLNQNYPSLCMPFL